MAEYAEFDIEVITTQHPDLIVKVKREGFLFELKFDVHTWHPTNLASVLRTIASLAEKGFKAEAIDGFNSSIRRNLS